MIPITLSAYCDLGTFVENIFSDSLHEIYFDDYYKHTLHVLKIMSSRFKYCSINQRQRHKTILP